MFGVESVKGYSARQDDENEDKDSPEGIPLFRHDEQTEASLIEGEGDHHDNSQNGGIKSQFAGGGGGGDGRRPKNQAYYPAPKKLKGFPKAGVRDFNKKSNRYRWIDKDGSILEWDKQHGEVEKYDKTGKNHLGAFDPDTGEKIKDRRPDRSIPKMVSVNSDNIKSWFSQYMANQSGTLQPPTPLTGNGSIQSLDVQQSKNALNIITIGVFGAAAIILTDGMIIPVLAL